MKTRPDSTKLQQLRSKTNCQLVALIHRRLDFGLHVVQSGLHAGAVEAYDEAHALLPWVDDVAYIERRRLQSKLDDLRGLLEESTIHAELRVQTACS